MYAHRLSRAKGPRLTFLSPGLFCFPHHARRFCRPYTTEFPRTTSVSVVRHEERGESIGSMTHCQTVSHGGPADQCTTRWTHARTSRHALSKGPMSTTALAPRETARATTRASARFFLRPLGIVGYDALEPAILSALATAEPLLLISDHGAAKTMLLVRIAAALRLEFRHYNASLLQFDDLAGFPIPDERTGAIRYAAPPGAIWGAEAVFFDEIGRCRPETANKLFPIVHERSIQGVSLDTLRFRWAATNPPVEAQDADREVWERYDGVEMLDPALADRFSYVLPLPRFHELSDADRLAIISGTGDFDADAAGAQVRELVEATTDILTAVSDDLRVAAAHYVLALVPRLAALQITIGGRRAATLQRNVVAIWAACTALGRSDDGTAFATALFASIPDIARRPISRAQLLAAHKSAWEQVALPPSDPVRLLLAVPDPARRATLALTLPGLKTAMRGEALCGALSKLPKVDAAIVAWLVLPRITGALRAVPATTVEVVAELVHAVADGGHSVRGYGATATWVAHVRALVAASTLQADDAEYLCNALCAHAPVPTQLSGGYAKAAANADLVARALETWRRCALALGGETRGADEAA